MPWVLSLCILLHLLFPLLALFLQLIAAILVWLGHLVILLWLALQVWHASPLPLLPTSARKEEEEDEEDSQLMPHPLPHPIIPHEPVQ
jgi:hypothetical protein